VTGYHILTDISKGERVMDTSTVQIVAAVAAIVLIGIVVMRRKKKKSTEED
jgi:LPXTG-motif cell wall-anchored protein